MKLTGPAHRRVSDVGHWVCAGKGVYLFPGAISLITLTRPPTVVPISQVLRHHKTFYNMCPCIISIFLGRR